MSEYGGGCASALGRLVGVVTLVNVQALQAQVQGAVSAVDQELEKAGIQRSDLRGQRASVEEAAAEGRKVPERAERLQRLTAARDALHAAISGKGGANALKVQSTAGLVAAREAFVHVYNKVAKPIVRGQLAALGREQELKDFFPDLAVNATSRRAADGEQAPVEGQPS